MMLDGIRILVLAYNLVKGAILCAIAPVSSHFVYCSVVQHEISKTAGILSLQMES